MLKGIPAILSPDILKTLMEMGHGDELVIADGNFPSSSTGKRTFRCDGHGIPTLLDAVLQLLPLDTYVDRPVSLMEVVSGDPYQPDIWPQYAEIIGKRERAVEFDFIDRFSFYERARAAYAVIATSEKCLYGNIIIKKGVVS
jgi:L-fucose mutarotase